MKAVSRLDWDSAFFGYEVGRLDISSTENFDLSNFETESKTYKLIYIFSEKKLTLNADFILVDEKVIYSQKIGATDLNSNQENGFLICSFNSHLHDVNQLRQLALESGIYSRFNIDPNFRNNEYQKLYLEWIDKSVNGDLAFEILIAYQGERIAGFTTIGKKRDKLADIGLVAVDSAFRGKGIGFGLMKETIKKAKEKGFEFIQVVTQMNNTPAVKLYEKTNFKIQQTTNIYHYWNQ